MDASTVAYLIVNLLWAAVAVYAVATAKTVVLPLLSKAQPAVKVEEEVIIPEDLHALALSESETWAQEETLRAIRESYDIHKDWNRVRFAMGIGQRGDA